VTEVAAATPVASPPPTAAPGPLRQRLQFLDAVRGIAAFTVAIQHSVEEVSRSYLRWSHEVFRPGEWGVVLFFVSSGFIIPVSLERYRSVGRFWIGRFFRLYPLYWAVVLGAGALYALDRYPLLDAYRLHWLRASVANVTMAQEFIGQPHVLGQAWTLSYELVFYLLVSLLFLAGLGRRPRLVLAAGLGTAVVIGGSVSPRLLTGGTTGERLAVGAVCAVGAGLAAAAAARRSAGAAVAAAAFAVAIVALVANRGHPLWFSALMLSSMVVGWLLQRWSAGLLSTSQVALAVGAASAAVVAAHVLHFTPSVERLSGAVTSARAEVLVFLGAYVVFIGALALRRHAFPAALRWLGEVSYSVYLVHGVVIAAVPEVGGPVTAVAVWLATTLVVSWATYRLFERPFQEWGRQLARRVVSPPR
jgi:peptidoglycan/LPS O-acetylase OafA/YrhL